MKVQVLGDAEIEKALISPTAIFDEPEEVVQSKALAKLMKIEILKRWELDARALQRATEENMSGGEPPPLDAVNEALAKLDPDGKALADFEKAPTKL
ncbi:hypothetical protein [Methylocystis parvus]|uniref:Uncharacterized protein n=1 Tax=Methylocystis parvus TaxID=134 RepID=A0A6B8M5Z4_9HYPH|nr:hypothetical protein [Methylocystis parvus]QGM97149.1 hypothetical protein F7D14_06425 [Methylocystis parvus]WBJ98947.1 hypothetical protein MMG94_13185 [Methylocystis parvus OBBP]